jgi:pyruvate,water dikinase
MISAEPAERVAQMAQLIAGEQSERIVLFQHGTVQEIEAALSENPALERAYRDYLAKFGERCLNELKLESATLHDDPLPLLRSVGYLAAALNAERGKPAPVAPSAPVAPADVRSRAEDRVAQALSGKPFRRAIFAWVLRNARDRVRDRENLRFERTRVFGRARQIFRALGEHLYRAGILTERRDVFYLEPQEIFGFVEGTATTSDLASLTALRKAEFERYAEMPPPARRFTTLGMVHLGNAFQGDASAQMPDVPDGDFMAGVGCSPGNVRGRVRVVRDPLTADLQPGDIIAAEHTDPSWIMILPLAAGLLVERGSLLSHAAIVSRELGVPGIVGLSGVMQWLTDGDIVEMDGGTGLVRRIEGGV